MFWTWIKNIDNDSDSPIFFQKLEDWGNNVIVKEGEDTDPNATISWVNSESEFQDKHIEIQRGNTVIAYIWQRGDHIRCSKEGWEDPGPEISGDSEVGGEKSLKINNDGVKLKNRPKP